MNELPPGWANARLADLGTWCGGGTPSKSRPEFWIDGAIPWVSPKDMKVDLIADAEDHITDAAVAASATNIVAAGSVLAVTRSGILRRTFPVAVTASPVAINQDLKALKPIGGIEPKYVAWYLRSDERSILHDCSKDGTTVDSIDFPALLKRQIPIAPAAEQVRIVAAIEEQFSRLDAGAGALKRARQKLKRMQGAVLQAAVEGRLLDTALVTEGVEKESSPKLPSDWSIVSVGDVAEVSGGITKSPKRFPKNNVIPFLRVANVMRDRLDLREVHNIEVFTGELERFRLRRGDLLVVEGNGSSDQIGRSALWDGSIDPCVHQNHLIRIRPADQILSKYLNIFWNAPRSMATIQAAASSTSGLYTLSTGKVRGIKLVVPPIRSQHQIVEEVDRQLCEIEALDHNLRIAQARGQALRSAILATAFSGNLVPQAPGDESAALLLKRIAEQSSIGGNKPTRTRKPRTPQEKVVI